MLTSGLRRGEALGAHWQDIDFSNALLRVRQTVIDIGGHAIISTPKTAAGQPTVKLSQTCVAALADHRERQRQRKIVQIGNDLVFTTGEGNPIQPRVLSRAFDVLQK
jgi:integrase